MNIKKYFMLLIVELSVKAISTVWWLLRMLCYWLQIIMGEGWWWDNQKFAKSPETAQHLRAPNSFCGNFFFFSRKSWTNNLSIFLYEELKVSAAQNNSEKLMMTATKEKSFKCSESLDITLEGKSKVTVSIKKIKVQPFGSDFGEGRICGIKIESVFVQYSVTAIVTFSLPRVTKHYFLSLMSVHFQAGRGWE